MSESPILRRPWLTVLLVLLLAAGMTYYHLGFFLPAAMERGAVRGLGNGYSFGNDFYPIWLTSREALLQHRNPYSQEMTREIQIGLFGRPLDHSEAGDPPADYRAFAYPAYVDLIFWPLSLFHFPVVRIGLAIVVAALTAFSIPLWLRALGLRGSPPLVAIAIMFTMSSYAVLEGLFAVQPGLLVGFLLAASFAALASGRLFLAGSLFAFTFIKPQMAVVVAAYLLLWSFSRWHERRHFVYGFLAWSALLAGCSLLVWPRWIQQWMGVLAGYKHYSPPPLISYSLGPRLGPLLGPLLMVALLATAAVVMWRTRRAAAVSPSFMLSVSLLLALTSITLLPGQAVYDHVVLLPGILLTVWTWRATAGCSLAFRGILVAGALALFWQWIAAIPLLAMRNFLSPPQFFANPLFLLPFHAAASIPLAACAVLGYMMWKTMRGETAHGK